MAYGPNGYYAESSFPENRSEPPYEDEEESPLITCERCGELFSSDRKVQIALPSGGISVCQNCAMRIYQERKPGNMEDAR